MASDEGDRKLAAILSADAVGYSKLMADDERATVNTLKEYRLAIARVIERHKGRVVNSPGDNILADFPSAVEAVQAACEIQQVLKGRNLELPAERRMEFRIGVNLGDIIEESDGTIYGDGVNIAARMEALADAGGICISNTVYDAVEGKVDSGFDFLGEQQVKNIAKPVNVYRIRTDGGTKPAPAQTTAPRHWKRPAIAAAAVLAFVSIGLLVWQKTGPGPEAPAPVIATPAMTEIEDPMGDEPAQPEAAIGPPNKASVAVLPFANLSADPAYAYFAEGLHENITSTLSHVDRLFVPARFATLQFRDESQDLGEVGRTLGVQHVLEGSVQIANGRVRITMQLIDVASRGHVWSQRYDRPLAKIFELQDDITLAVVNALQVELVAGEQALRWRGGTDDIDAWALVQRGIKQILKFTSEDNTQARTLLDQALKLDPEYASAWVLRGYTFKNMVDYGWNTDPSLLDQAEEDARRAIELDPGLPSGYSLMTDIIRLRGDLDDAAAWGRKAVSLDPNGSDSRAHLSIVLAQSGDPSSAKDALKVMDEAMALSPVYPDWYLWDRGRPLFTLGRYHEAAESFLAYFERTPEAPGFVLAVAALAESGRLDEAKAFLEKRTADTRDFSIGHIRSSGELNWIYDDPAMVEPVLDVLRDLGVPEHR